MNYLEYSIYALLWLSFGVIHSVLASSSAKSLLHPFFGKSYRLCYNLFSALYIGLVLIAGHQWLGANSMSFEINNEFDFIITGCRWVGIGVVLAALTQYDLGRFGGLTQIQQGIDRQGDEEALHVTGMHRYVRHPLYLGVYLFFWGGIVDEFGLQTALWGSLYLLIGTWFEERRLIARYGRSYIEYREKVPSIFPIRGRAI